MQPSKTPMTSPYAARIRRAIERAHGVAPLIYPAGFGSLPGYAFTRILGVDAFVTPYGNADEANHAPNENLKLDCFHNGIRTGAALLEELGRVD
jgi:acetylornithine deacetylase/succinyl-diaminopimelate desuccinylase-like protein